jgi:hypothetical protein
MNRKEKIAQLIEFYRSLSAAIPNLPPTLQAFLKQQQRHVASRLAALGADMPILHDHLGGAEDGLSFLTDGVRLDDLASIDVTSVGTLPPLDVVPMIDPESPAGRCLQRTLNATGRLASRKNHWWQNWGKQLYCICQKMFFPVSVDEIAAAIKIAEQEEMPLKAIGGGWSFSDVVLDSSVWSFPNSTGVELLAKLVPLAETFSSDPSLPVIAEVAVPAEPLADRPGSLLLLNPSTKEPDTRFSYLGDGRWSVSSAELRNLFIAGYRPIRSDGQDNAGSLVMFLDPSGDFDPDYFYMGNGQWSSAIYGDSPRTQTLSQLLSRPFSSRPRASNAAFNLSRLLKPQPIYLINTDSLVSSLQQNLPNLLAEEARRRTEPGTAEDPNIERKYYFHVEAGITMSDLGKLLSHQSPRLAIEASGGSPGATLAGALATATHGGEHTTPLLVDRVKAVHLVGPGGVQWWIEGDDPIADPDKLIESYPCISRSHIIRGIDLVDGIRPQDWLNAVVVSMGSMGVIYSLVLEVVPIFGVHQVVVESTWTGFLSKTVVDFGPLGFKEVNVDDLRSPPTLELRREWMGRLLYDQFASGSLTGILRRNNMYVDIAIDPNPIINESNGTRDWNCWVVNREMTQAVPFDTKPSPKDLIGRVGESIAKNLGPVEINQRLAWLQGIPSTRKTFRGEWDLGDLHNLGGEFNSMMAKLDRLTGSADTLNTILDLITAPFEASNDPANVTKDFNTARAIVSGLLSALLGVEGGRGEYTGVVSQVGDIGFPASGIMGTAIEIATAPEDAFPFIQSEILDQIREPFFGYVSVRFCPQTQSLLGMQQYAPSVMIEVVAFRTYSAQRFIYDLEERTINRIRQGTQGLDAMFHWGLENQVLDAATLRAIPAINTGSPSKLEKFITIRSLIGAPAPEGRNVFDNGFTRRLGL